MRCRLAGYLRRSQHRAIRLCSQERATTAGLPPYLMPVSHGLLHHAIFSIDGRLKACLRVRRRTRARQTTRAACSSTRRCRLRRAGLRHEAPDDEYGSRASRCTLARDAYKRRPTRARVRAIEDIRRGRFATGDALAAESRPSPRRRDEYRLPDYFPRSASLGPMTSLRLLMILEASAMPGRKRSIAECRGEALRACPGQSWAKPPRSPVASAPTRFKVAAAARPAMPGDALLPGSGSPAVAAHVFRMPLRSARPRSATMFTTQCPLRPPSVELSFRRGTRLSRRGPPILHDYLRQVRREQATALGENGRNSRSRWQHTLEMTLLPAPLAFSSASAMRLGLISDDAMD